MKFQRSDVEFDAQGTTLRGWLYVPVEGDGPYPAVVMAHGFSALKEMDLDRYAEVFASSGLAALAYDNRNLGASDGTPRFEVDPVAQARDYRHAITYVQSRPEVDPTRVGVWGTSYSGGLVLVVAAIDRRVRCVVSQVPYISGYDTMVRVMALEDRMAFYQMLDNERRSRAAGNPPSTVPVCVDDQRRPEGAPGRLTHAYFHRHKLEKGLSWENKVTVRSLELRLEYEATPFLERISPTPLLMIVSDDDTITPTDVALRAYDRALEPKAVILVHGDHYAPYMAAFAQCSAAARDWFVRHL